MNTTIDNSRISKHLGKVSEYKTQYDPSLLVAEPRINNRRLIGIPDGELPFVGYDFWNAYETSFLLECGAPVNVITKIAYKADSPSIVESKSLKLYLNSFNMTKMGTTRNQAVENFRRFVSGDLSKLLQTDVYVTCTTPFMYEVSQQSPIDAYRRLITPSSKFPNSDHIVYVDLDEHFYTLIQNVPEPVEGSWLSSVYQQFYFNDYTENRAILTDTLRSSERGEDVHYRFRSALLRSNCRVTGQPDFGDIFIDIKSRYEIDYTSILKYIVSFRNECHFHEESNEGIFHALNQAFKPSILNVMTLYSRRGGIDINSIRSLNNNDLLAGHYLETVLDPVHSKTSKQ